MIILDRRWIHKFLRSIKVTRRGLESELWRQIQLIDELEFEFCDYHDLKNERIFSGAVKSYFDSDGIREILLMDVEVFDFQKNLIEQRPYIYLAFPADQVRLDFYNKGEKQNVTT